jgi:NAD(P)-dependent dehydrogenase (short-subunit alcohol dehydrogenase family)
MDGPLTGQVALVTGAGRRRGIGRAIAIALARAGADIAVHGSGADPAQLQAVADEVRAAGPGRVLAVEAELTDAGAVRGMAEAITAGLGPVDVLVNNAGVAGPAGRFTLLELDDADWYRTVDANLNAVYLVTKAFLGAMVGAQRGAVVNISSVAGRAGQPRMGAYCATKFAVIGLTQQLALEVAPHVRVNCVCPGSTDTEMMDGTFARRDAAAGTPHGTAKATRVKGLPLQRQGQPEDIADAVLFLVTPQSAWVTGQTLNVDGGQRMD